jgi:AcrR family transcriptional regulator
MTTRLAVSAESRVRVQRRPAHGPAPASRITVNDQETRSRLLKVSERLFADRGFKNVTVREICRAARANVSAINYHFGDKLGLYREVLQSASDAMRATNEAARRSGEGRPPDEKLRRYVLIFLQGLLASNYETLHRLIHREMNDPTPVLDAFVEQSVRPRVEYLAGIVAELIGGKPTEQRVLRCVASIHSQSIAYLPNPIAARLGFSFKPTPLQIEEAARHIADFSLAGVRAIGSRKSEV